MAAVGGTGTELQNTSSTSLAAANDEDEQLDYDEEADEERRPEAAKAERKPEPVKEEVAASAAATPSAKPIPTTQTALNKCYVNPNFRGRLPFGVGGRPLAPLPSLVGPPLQAPAMMFRPPVNVNLMAQNVLMHSLRPIQQGPFPPQLRALPPASARYSAPVPGTAPPLTTVQQDLDGTLRFRATIPPPQAAPRVTVVRAGGTSTSAPNNWDSSVEDFLRKTKTTSRKRYSGRSRSRSYSRSASSSSSRSASRSSRSPSDRSRSRSRSPRRSRQRSSHSRKRRPRARDSRTKRRRSSERDYRKTASRPRRRRSEELRNTLECAEAIGLDKEYVRKMDEQKRLREEVTKRKYNGDSKAKEEKKSERVSEQKLKPYLAVVIHNLNSLSDAYKRMKMIASAVGPTKKVWQTSDDSISVIFESHEHAKTFMLQYHMKPFNGITLDIGLEKVFLNLSAIP